MADRTLDLTTDQWAMAEETATILKPFITLTELLSQEENVSVVPLLTNVKKWHVRAQEDDSNATKTMKSKLVEETERRRRMSRHE